MVYILGGDFLTTWVVAPAGYTFKAQEFAKRHEYLTPFENSAIRQFIVTHCE
jgi:hypothetical protein